METKFTLEDFNRANEVWKCNCGPGALAAMMNLTLDEVRPHMNDFESKGYTDPRCMRNALRSLRAESCQVKLWNHDGPRREFPTYGLCRVQWEGPWTESDAPPTQRLRYSHWIGAMRAVAVRTERDIGIFDVNALNNGSGWCSLADWANHLAPYLAKNHDPRASGGWHLTHKIEVEKP